jgi:multidrug efflux system outer membrane protein
MRCGIGLALLCAVALAGCKTVGDDYVRPPVEPPARWRVEYPEAAELANARWWERFGDPVLAGLVEEALRANLDIPVAAARVEQFLGNMTTVQSQLYPQISYGADASRNRNSRVGPTPIPSGVDPWYTYYQASIGATWQLDLFGRVRRQTEATAAQIYATEQGRRGVVLTVVTAVASSYIQLRALDRQLEVARHTAANYAEQARIFDLRFKGGVVSMVEVQQIQSQYQTALATIPRILQQIEAQENLIGVLLGRNPGPVPRGKPIDALTAPEIPYGLPSLLLERRPDVIQAEYNLVAANANVAVAKSLYYPTISLTGLLGSASAALGDFLTGPSAVVQLAAGLSGPLFTFGQIEGQVQTAEAAQRESVLVYRRTTLDAFREVNDALVGVQRTREQYSAQVRRTDALREYARLTRLRFDGGYSGYFEVLYAENELFNAELAAVNTLADNLNRVVDTYKAVGGGWVDEADALVPAHPLSPDAPKSPPGSRGR